MYSIKSLYTAHSTICLKKEENEEEYKKFPHSRTFGIKSVYTYTYTEMQLSACDTRNKSRKK
jgi:hypothetical protein